jgi:hypothetical protein
MMKCRKLIAWAGLLCCSALQAEANADIESAIPAKRSIQVVTRSDGSVLDRLALPAASKNPTQKSTTRHIALPASPEAWLARMMDPTKNGLAAKNPELFAEWLDAVTEPRFMTALASVAMTPDTYSKTLGQAIDPAAVRNWAEFADPQIYFRWMAAGLDPRFYQAVFNRMTDSGKLRRWGFSLASTAAANREASIPGAQEWLQMPIREGKPNPWLLNSVNYRY